MAKQYSADPEVIRNYAPNIMPKIPELLDKLEKSDWRKALKIIHDKHKMKVSTAADVGSALRNPEAGIERFTIDFMDFIARNDPELNSYTIQEISKIRTVDCTEIRSSLDLEGIILDSIETRSETFSRKELSQLHNILKNIYAHRSKRASSAINFFDQFLSSIDNIPESVRSKIIDHAYEISTRDAVPLQDRGKLLASYGNATERNLGVLGERIVRWSSDIVTSNKSVKELMEYFEDTHDYFNGDLETIAGGTPLSQVHGRLLAYVQALTGENIKIEKSETSDLYCSFSEDTFFLPFTVNVGKNDENNLQIYKAIASYQAGAFMFGTYDLDISQVNQKTAKRFGEEGNISNFFNSFDNPEFSQGLFELLEFSRLDYRLKEKFPGLREGIGNLKQHISKSKKSPSLLDRIKTIVCREDGNANPINNLEEIITPEINSLMIGGSTVERTVETVTRVYEKLSKKYNLAEEKLEEKIIDINVEIIERERDKKEASYLVAKPSDELTLGNRFKYDEWDESNNSYKPEFVQVVETPYPEVTDNDYVSRVLQQDREVIQRLRSIFETLSPEEFEVIKKQLSGEVDYDLLVGAIAEKASGITPSEKVYAREYKDQRSVTSMVLSENSGSLRKFLDIKNPDFRLIDIIKKSKIYFSEALDAIGDDYALAAFSGETEKNVEFHLLKDFGQSYDRDVKRNIGSIRPLKQNRDGAGIRHATSLLSKQPERLRMLFYLMEGLPHDFGYESEYAIEDTKKAIIESKQHGCLPIVIASGKNVNEGIRSLSEHCLYREVSDPKHVPLMLPDLYRRIAI